MILQTVSVAPAIDYVSKFTNLAVDYAPKLAGAIIVYLIGSMIIKWVGNIIVKALQAKQLDVSLQSFLASFVKIMLTILLLLSVFGVLGVNLTSFAAILAGLAVGVGAALNGTLGNFAGGIMMLIFKPFKVGDLVEAQGHVGNVKELGIFNTFLLTPENKTVILANGAVSTGTIVNYTTHGNLRVDLAMAIDPNTSVDKAREIAVNAMLSNPKVLASPAPEVNVLKVGDGMVTLAVRPYCDQADYWDVYFGVQESVKKAFDANGISQPIPHRIIISK